MIMWNELGISGGTAIIILIALYFVIKWAVKNGIKEAYSAITGKKTDEDVRNEKELKELGFECIKPEGAFYLWVKSPVDNEEEFVEEGKKLHLLMVKGSAFGCGGFVRLAYCVSHETVKNSLPAFEKLAQVYGLK